MKRRFQGLRSAPRERYDVVVIGGGIGGLFCACLLAKGGASVLLVEQHYMLGGYCSTFRRAGFTFDASSHFYPLLGNPSTLTGRLLRELEVPTSWVQMDPVDSFNFPDGSSFDVPADLETYRARLAREFPHQRDQLDEFFREVRQAYLAGLLAYFREQPNQRMEQFGAQTLQQALARQFDDPKLRLLLCADCAHWGAPPSRTSYVFDSMLRLSYFLGNYYPVGGSQAFADDLAMRFEALGGHIAMSTEALRVEAAPGDAREDQCVVRSVRLRTTRGRFQGEHRVRAGAVVNNGDLWRCAEQLAPEAFDGRDRARLASLRPSLPCHLVHLGLRNTTSEELQRAQGYYWRSWDPEDVGRGALVCKVFVPTLYDPSLAPPGGHVVMLQRVVDVDWALGTDGSRRPGAHQVGSDPERVEQFNPIDSDPIALRARIEEECMQQLRRVLPELERRVVTRHAATGYTAERFTFNRAGAMLGWEMSPEQLGEGRPGITSRMHGLFHTGHWARPGGGITPVIVSAQQVARRILEDRVDQATEPSETTRNLEISAGARAQQVRGQRR